MSQTDRFLRACRREAVDATPIWLMRQAGRYMAEYRALRERYSILELIQDPALAAEVTLQPIKAFNLDAAIIFADILPRCAGRERRFIGATASVIGDPLHRRRCRSLLVCRKRWRFHLQAIRLKIRAELDGKSR